MKTTRCSTPPFHSTEVSRSNLDSYRCFFALDSSQAVSISHDSDVCLQHWRQQSYRRETVGWRNGGVAIEKLSICALRLNWAVTEWECGCDKTERLPLRNKRASSPAVWSRRRPKVCMKDFLSRSRAECLTAYSLTQIHLYAAGDFEKFNQTLPLSGLQK